MQHQKYAALKGRRAKAMAFVVGGIELAILEISS